MLELPSDAYLWVKALHIISVIAWMAGLLYLPRLFIYHTDAEAGGELSETLKIMERRLLRIIMNPAMISSFVFGGLLLMNMGEGAWQEGWLHAKLVFIVGLFAMHMAMARWRREFAEDRNTRSQKFYRFANEAPTLLMIGIVILAVVRPF
ncbi:MAG: protoporphyrinogen oxidase HemJ [Alphaproteobacteria bacterium]|jgi:protoporphyrinogen IX oxidase|nr:protoporphyrinogen oxidase HemJ [Alphaproteobacteria bacterium]MBT7944207.1 protoporphyrinogen oxidase HemJ [Alphaproteobacteria bacterium]